MIEDGDVKWMYSKPLHCEKCRCVVRHDVGVTLAKGQQKVVIECTSCHTVTK